LADRQRLKQVLLNLLSNAVKFNRAYGSVVLRCETTENGMARIVVADTGCGIDDEGLKKIFTPFERLGADRGAISGTGLGLALSKRMVEAMGGIIGVESTVGSGSRFRCELPWADSAADGKENERLPDLQAALQPGNSRLGTVLCIEDNLPNLRLIEEIVARYPGVRLLAAAQGRLGLDLATTHRPDWILLDLHLPDVSGEEVLSLLQSDPRTGGIPVTILSADATSALIKQLMTAGAREYLTKPIDVRQLIDLLEATLPVGSVAGQPCVSREERPGSSTPLPTNVSFTPGAVSITDLPNETVEQLRSAIQNGAKARLDELIAAIDGPNPECARTLKGLADRYEYDALTNLLAETGR
jgi:CheY-like chemotaxis protein